MNKHDKLYQFELYTTNSVIKSINFDVKLSDEQATQTVFGTGNNKAGTSTDGTFSSKELQSAIEESKRLKSLESTVADKSVEQIIRDNSVIEFALGQKSLPNIAFFDRFSLLDINKTISTELESTEETIREQEDLRQKEIKEFGRPIEDQDKSIEKAQVYGKQPDDCLVTTTGIYFVDTPIPDDSRYAEARQKLVDERERNIAKLQKENAQEKQNITKKYQEKLYDAEDYLKGLEKYWDDIEDQIDKNETSILTDYQSRISSKQEVADEALERARNAPPEEPTTRYFNTIRNAKKQISLLEQERDQLYETQVVLARKTLEDQKNSEPELKWAKEEYDRLSIEYNEHKQKLYPPLDKELKKKIDDLWTKFDNDEKELREKVAPAPPTKYSVYKDDKTPRYYYLTLTSDFKGRLSEMLDDEDFENNNGMYSNVADNFLIELTLDGIYGFRLFQHFAINNLPKPYVPGNCIFMVKEVSHEINRGKWETKVTAMLKGTTPNAISEYITI